MAKFDDLIEQVIDPTLRSELAAAVRNLRRRKTFGLVYEEHVPEIALLGHVPIKIGANVYRRADAAAKHLLVVTEVDGTTATVTTADGQSETVRTEDLVVARRFGDRIYPTLTPLSAVECASGRPFHAVINGENFHALQLLTFLYEG